MAIGVRRSSTGILYSFTPKMWAATRGRPGAGTASNAAVEERPFRSCPLSEGAPIGRGRQPRDWPRLALHIEILHFQRVLLDKVAPGLHLVAHQRGKDVVHPRKILE